MRLLDVLFGCRHKRISFPLGKRQMYVVCLDCAREFDYDWRLMKMRKQRTVKLYRAAVEIQPIAEPKITSCRGAEELERIFSWEDKATWNH